MRETFHRLLAILLLFILSPILLVFYLLIKFTSTGPFIFKQRRLGKNLQPFIIYKIRTMRENSDKVKKNLMKLNESDGPVFKIYNDPRYTKVGRFLAHSGFDELPQLINVVKGDMTFVGPRPLPPEEATAIPKRYRQRFSVLPGITSSWIIKGAHNLKFVEWMKLDIYDVKQSSLKHDWLILIKTIWMMVKAIGS